jgi:hypothetical protein
MSSEFQQFCAKWSIKIVHCTPEHHQSNGLAESAVKRFKKWLSVSSSNGELAMAMLQWAQTPIASGRPSPAQIHFGRNLRDELHARVEPSLVEWQDLKQWKEARLEEVAQGYNRSSKLLKPLAVHDEVFVLCRNQWRPGRIVRVMDQPRAYVVRFHDTGRLIERNRKFLRPNLTGSLLPRLAGFSQSLLTPQPEATSHEDDNTISFPVPVDAANLPADDDSSHGSLPSPGRTSSNRSRVSAWHRERAWLQQPKTSRVGRVCQMPQRYGD